MSGFDEIDLPDPDVVGDDGHVPVGHPLRGPDRAGRLRCRASSRCPTENISSTQTSFGSAMLRASDPPVDGRKPYSLHERRDDGERLARGARPLQREHLRLLDGDDLLGDALDVRHVELAPLAARALGNRDLVLVDEGVAGVEVRVGARHLRDLADDLAVVAHGRPPRGSSRP